MSLILIFSKARKKRAVSHKSSTATLSVKAHCCGLCVSLFLFYNELPGLLMLTKRKGFFCLHLEAEKKSKQHRANSGKTLLSASPHMSGITVGVCLSTRPIKDPTSYQHGHTEDQLMSPSRTWSEQVSVTALPKCQCGLWAQASKTTAMPLAYTFALLRSLLRKKTIVSNFVFHDDSN